MLMHDDTVLEVEHISKLYSRIQSSTRKRMAASFGQALVGRSEKPPKNLHNGEFWSLDDVSFTLKRGEAIGVIGLNGAGKTTLLRLLAGQILPDKGEIRMLGRTASMIDLTAGFQMSASGKRNIFLRGAMLGRNHDEITSTYDEIVDFAELGDAIDAPINTYSSGMTMRLAFSIMVAMKPDILFIDEVLAVGDFRFRQKCLGRIRELREQAAFVLVSHSMADIKMFCNRAIVLHEGKAVFAGEPEEAIDAYEQMKFPAHKCKEEKARETLKPQYHNDGAITEISHYWCDAAGNRIDKIRSGETLYLRAAYRINHSPRHLIMGVPVWADDGSYVTGFSTELESQPLTAQAGKTNEYILEVPGLAFNPGEYISNFGVTDGPEFLYRGQNNILTVLPTQKQFWGVVSLDHNWRQKARKSKGEVQ